MTVYCNRCNGTDVQWLYTNGITGTQYYKCNPCTAELGKTYRFPVFPETAAAQTNAEDLPAEVSSAED